MDSVAALVSQVGFPIGAFFLLYYLVKGELKEVTQAVNQNTLAIQRLLTYMEAKEGADIDGQRCTQVPGS